MQGPLEIDVQSGIWTDDPHSDASALRVVAVGDVCPHHAYPLAPFFGDDKAAARAYGNTLSVLADKDLSVANLELPLSTQGAPIIKDGPALSASPQALAGFKAGRFDVACMANNHVLDLGPAALLQTMQALRAAGIDVLGAGADEQAASEPVFVQRRGRRIGLLAFAENEFSVAAADSAGASPYRPGPNTVAVSRARAHCDLLLVFVHGGSEYCPFPSPRMVRDYRALADAGADAVIGHHPHTVQGMELHNGVPILYSLGNFLFWVPRHDENNPMWPLEMMARLTFAERRCLRLEVFPVRSDAETGTALLSGNERQHFLARLNRLSQIIADPPRHRRLWQAYCLARLPFYLHRIAETRAGLDRADLRRIAAAHLKNLFACEAHHEVIVTALELWRNGVEAADTTTAAELRTLLEP